MTEFEKIYSEYFPYVYKYVFSLCQSKDLAEEITQETFFKALRNIDKFNGHCKLSVWLCQIAKNSYFTYCQKNKRTTDTYVEDIESEYFEQGLINGEDILQIHKAIHILQEPYKEVLSLRIFGELSFKQIAEIFEKTESWARVTFHRAKIKLREDLK